MRKLRFFKKKKGAILSHKHQDFEPASGKESSSSNDKSLGQYILEKLFSSAFNHSPFE
jgi:hypothetical protein